MFFGILGVVIATLGLIAPSIIVILIIAQFLKAFKDSKYVKNAFYGLRPASTGLIAAAAVSVIVSTLFNMDVIAEGFNMAFFNWKGIALYLSAFLR